MIDVRAVGVDGGALREGSTSKSVDGVQIGDVVTFGVFAQVSGTNGVNDELIAIASGSFSSGAGGLLGDLKNALVPQFEMTGSTNGNQADFDSDGDLDVGSLGTTSSNKTLARANPPASGTPLNSNTSEIQISTLSFMVTAGSGHASVNFIPQSTSSGANWNEDGVATFKTPTTATFSAGAPVSVSVPEPSALGLLGLAGAGLLARRRTSQGS